MKYLLFALCISELLLTTYLQNFAGPFISPVLLLGCSAGVAFCYLRIALQPAIALAATPKINPKLVFALQVAAVLLLSFITINTLRTIWWVDATKHNAGTSDIIQNITVMVKRFLAREQPYTTIHLEGYDLSPTYLPLQWLPYAITEWMHKDYRWVPAVSLWLASLYFFARNSKLRYTGLPLAFKVLLPVWPLIVWYTSVTHSYPMFQLTVEGLIAAYYLVVATSISEKRIWILAAGIALCLLSRFSIILWFPLCLAAFFIAGEKKKALVIGGTFLVCFILFYWLPFLRHDPMVFIKGYQYYSHATLDEWQRDIPIQGKYFLDNGLGFTSWALKLVPGNPEHILSVYQGFHLLACSLTIFALLLFYWLKRSTIPLSVFLLFSFKIYLAVFYSFIQLPYNYLFLVPVIISSALLANGFYPAHTSLQKKLILSE